MRIAVIGTGISGNVAAWALSPSYEVVVYERRDRPGGHSATVDIDYDGAPMSVDTGFIVYNTLNYPHLTALFDTLGVETEGSDMSFSVSLEGGKLEWSGDGLRAIFAQKRNLASPSFLTMLTEILRFNKTAKADLAGGRLKGLNLGDYLDEKRFTKRFIGHYIIPMGAAIWSTPSSRILDFPAETFIAFFDNHRLLQFNQSTWRTVRGGSRSYVEKMVARYRHNLRLSSPVKAIERENGRITVIDGKGDRDTFDHLIIATHSDQARAILGGAASEREHAALSRIPYRENRVFLHRDPKLMPRRKRVWCSWNFMTWPDQNGPCAKTGALESDGEDNVTVSYWMNRLQNLDRSRPVFVSLNPPFEPDPDLTFGRFLYDHPQYDAEALKGQVMLKELQGERNTWFCGAYHGHGFHEDGLSSGLEVVRALGGTIPWERDRRIAEAAE
ncbi:MAG: FAD-dependent oxidoreductase [Hyphomicrobiales bacterium]|nr:FAD-dependent oxidoreductase [Hyphomicrobiales bacterium]